MGGGVQRYRNAKVDIFLGAGAQRVRAFARAEEARLAYARQLLVNPHSLLYYHMYYNISRRHATPASSLLGVMLKFSFSNYISVLVLTLGGLISIQ